MNEIEEIKNEILIYTDEENIRVEVFYENENVWLNTEKIAQLFDIERSVITKHINNIYNDNELDRSSTCAKIAQVQKEGNREVKRNIDYYNLDMIISVGFRTNSKKAIKFRTWANKIIKDYMIQGFALDDDRFMKARKGDQEYFKRLLERIKLIRTSERMFYQKITDIFAECSIDYDKTSEIARDFYATIQNKFHYAITKNTAAEIIYNRVDSKIENMGLTNWQKSPDGKILKSDIAIAKNYLKEQELKDLNSIVNIFLDIAENRAERQIAMKMTDWIKRVDITLSTNDYDVLSDKGSISHEQAKEKAETEYNKFKIIQDKRYISDFDKLIDETNIIENNT
ncbi:MAG: virulence RhuM family protein [Oscillospiraceae bacterium]|nr:virulence RhuM family protein [Oscillospiraceae bacterium]